MKRLMSTMACAAALCGLGAFAHASIPVKMAPAASHSSALVPIINRVIVVHFVQTIMDPVETALPFATQPLEHVDQAAEFDRTS